MLSKFFAHLQLIQNVLIDFSIFVKYQLLNVFFPVVINTQSS